MQRSLIWIEKSHEDSFYRTDIAADGRGGDGVFLYQGDIKIDQRDVTNIINPGAPGRKKRALMKNKKALWTSPIYYEFSSSLNCKYEKYNWTTGHS